VRANGNEIRACLGIIIFLQPDGMPVVEIGGFIVKRVHGEILSQYQGNGRRCGGVSPYARTVNPLWVWWLKTGVYVCENS